MLLRPKLLQRVGKLLETVLVPCLLLFSYCTGLENVRFHGDEGQWIVSSASFEKYFRGQFTADVWNESYWTLTQPPLARYVIGIGRRLGGYRAADLQEDWAWELSPIPEKLLWWARLPMALLAVFCITVAYFLWRQILGRAAAYSWLFLSLTSAYFQTTLRRAMGETTLLACSTLVLLACIGALREAHSPTTRLWRILGWITLMGITIGMAGATKLNGFSILVAGIVVAFWMAWQQGRTPVHRIVFPLGAIAFLGFATFLSFVGLNPYLWPAPVERTMHMIEQRADEITTQITNRPLSHIKNLEDRVEILPKMIFQQYAALNALEPLNIFLTMIGTGVVLHKCRQWFLYRQGQSAGIISLAVLLVSLSAATPALMTPLNWDRYYLFPIYFSTLLIAAGGGWILTKSYRLVVQAFIRYMPKQH